MVRRLAPAASYALSTPGESNPGNTHRRQAGDIPGGEPSVENHLSRVGGIRTHGLFVPNEALYQAEPQPV